MIPIKTTQIVLLLVASLPVWVEADDLRLPATSSGPPGAGKKVAVTAPEYAGTGVHHMLYLPPDWQADWKAQGRSWPVIVEFTGNKAPSLGSTGLVEDAALGFGVSGGRFIWVVLPYVNETHDQNEGTWWGDEEATATYAKTNVPRICAEYGGDPRAVFLCGFSRGAIGVNYIGLHDDDIARLWCAFLSHDHYDGVKEWKGTTWGTPLDAYRAAAAERLRRLNGRPVLVCQNNDTSDIERYLNDKLSCADFAFLPVRTGEIFHEFPNEWAVHPHTDRWLVKDSANRQQVWAWVDRVVREMHGADQGDAQDAEPVASWTFIADGDDWNATLTESTGVCRDILQPIGGQLRSGVLSLGVHAGDPEYLAAPASEDLRLGPSYSIEAWVLPTKVTGWGRIVLQWGAEKQWAYHLAIRDGAASLYHGQVDGTYRWCEGGVLRVGQVAHLVGVARRNDARPSASELELYVDGKQVATAPFDGTVMRLEQVDVGIGDSAQAPSADARFRGYLPRVTIWNRALTAEEIRCRAADAGIAGQLAALQQEIAAARRERMQRQLAERERLLDQLVALGAERIVVAERAPGRDYQQHYYANFGYSCVDPDYWLHGADGGRLLVLNVRQRGLEVLLDDSGGAVRDPQVHYSGQKILFSYRRGGTHHYNLYEINADGTGLRQLTDGPWDDVEPVYLPDGGIAFCSTRCQRYIGCWLAPSAILFRCDAQGGNIRMLSSGSFSENTPSVLPDGRLLYTRWEYVNRDAVSFHHLWTMNPDGTKPMVFFGNQQLGGVFIDARPIPASNHVVLIDSPGHGQNEHAGRVATVSSSQGPNAQSALKHVTAQAAYRDPYPIQPGLYLAVRGNQLLVLSDDGAEQVLFDNDQMLHEPSVIRQRDREPVLPNLVDLAESTGTVVLQNAYAGRNMQGVPPGAIRRLLVLEDLPKP
ncbi:MAG: hypothetical protein FJ276_12340, partial [Planctomycetes bacterium]|nr:hypothetical protein [Planctomycetota bacterium]